MVKLRLVLFFVIAASGLSLFVLGCKTPKKQTLDRSTQEARMRPLDAELSRALLVSYKPWIHPRGQKYVNDIARRILSANHELLPDVEQVNVVLFDSKQVILQAGFVGTLYMSRGISETVRFESELVFLISREIGKLQSNVMGKKILQYQKQQHVTELDYIQTKWFEKGGLFSEDPNEGLEADRLGVQIAYATRYDPRGAVSVLQRLESPTIRMRWEAAKILPFWQERLNFVRDEIAKLSPMRNPIVTRQEFDEFLAWAKNQKGKTNARRAANN